MRRAGSEDDARCGNPGRSPEAGGLEEEERSGESEADDEQDQTERVEMIEVGRCGEDFQGRNIFRGK